MSARGVRRRVIPAKAGIQPLSPHWIPAFAGMTNGCDCAVIGTYRDGARDLGEHPVATESETAP